jgi:hypothetical protein
MLTVATAAHAVALSLGEPEAIPPPRPPIEIAFQRPPQRAPEQLSRLPERAPKWSRALSDEARDMTPLAATQQLRAETRPPMPGAWNATILVGTHHKTGTVLLAKVFRVAAKMFSVPRHKNNYTACADLFATHARGVCIDEHVNANSMREWLRPQQPFIHAVRHPLEMCISAYIYHKQGAEPWLLKPMPDLGGLNLMQHYQALPPVDGVRFECRRMVTELVESAVLYNRALLPSIHAPRTRLSNPCHVDASVALNRKVRAARQGHTDGTTSSAYASRSLIATLTTRSRGSFRSWTRVRRSRASSRRPRSTT